MKFLEKLNRKNLKQLPSTLLVVFVVIIVIVSFIISANKMMEYLAIRQENELLKTIRDNKLLEVDELKYYIYTEVDDAYKERMARFIGYCYPDEIIYFIE